MSMPDLNDFRIAYAKAVAKAWSDTAYKEQLLNDPRAALASAGIDIPSEVEISVVEDSDSKKHLVLPVPPAEGELAEDRLGAVAGGNFGCFQNSRSNANSY